MPTSTVWHHTGRSRPPFANAPGPGQESVWDYPRPPIVVADARKVEVAYRGREIAASTRTLRILETAGPPTFYVPEDDVDLGSLVAATGTSWCEWKGTAQYWRLVFVEAPNVAVAWSYPDPNPAFTVIAGFISFYPGRLACTVTGERVQPQPGGFYGGWVTREIAGPIKGGPGTETW
jgi:uncharacterized protein (DUF427 family)